MANDGDGSSTPHETSAPFNNAIDRLMSISKCIAEINDMSEHFNSHTPIPGVILSSGQAQHIKHRKLKSLYRLSVPLIPKPEKKKELFQQIYNIQLKFRKNYSRNSGSVSSESEVFDPQTDLQMDIIINNIQEALQEQKYFMPPRDDPRLAILRR